MTYAYEDIVTLSSARGGWEGVISHVGVGGRGTDYLVHRLTPDYTDRSKAIVNEADIVSSHTNYPTWKVDDTVTLYGHTGTITDITGNIITVEITVYHTHRTKTRVHRVPRWRVLLENN